ncbi:hypothetical protein M0804_001026 [Polistes exclamans]|nr:hypothetical protein M0804_001026 [Polistes exclamans]
MTTTTAGVMMTTPIDSREPCSFSADDVFNEVLIKIREACACSVRLLWQESSNSSKESSKEGSKQQGWW